MKKRVVETKNLTKKFGDLTAVDKINMHVNKGEIVGFLGPNGAGKTTAISMLSTILKPTSGDALIEGHSLVNEPHEIRKLIGIVPQEIIIYDYLSPKENCEFFAKMHKLSQEKINNMLQKLFKTLNLEEKMHVKSATLSGGQKRRLNLMMGLVMDPDIVFLDEPTAGLDPQSSQLTWEYIRNLRDKEGKTIILTTHNMHEAEELSDRVYIIDHGKIIADGTPQALRANIGEGEIFDLVFKDEINLNQLKGKIKGLGSYISKINVLSEKRMVISATGGIKRLVEIEQLLPNKLETLENLNIRSNSLEDVFLVLTGRGLRE